MRTALSKLTLPCAALAICNSLFAPSAAHALTYELKSIFNDGGSVFGTFSFDPSTYDASLIFQSFATKWDFVTTPGSILPGATYTPADGFNVVLTQYPSSGTVVLIDFQAHPYTVSITDIYLIFTPSNFSALLSGQHVVPLSTYQTGYPSLECRQCNPYRLIEPGAAVYAVPEPPTWVMMLIGFSGLGFDGYRRRKKGRQSPFGRLIRH